MSNPSLSADCLDYGSEQCPCVLSSLNQCLVCSHLQGSRLCDCDWGKYCVYINYLHDRKKVAGLAGGRRGPLRAIKMDPFGYHLFFSAPEWTGQSARPLSQIYLKGERESEDPVPAVILDTYPEQGVIAAALILRGETYAGDRTFPAIDTLYPCRAGDPALGGLPLLDTIRDKELVLYAGGSGQLLVCALIDHYIDSTNKITVCLENRFPAITQGLKRSAVSWLVAENGRFPEKALEKTPDVVVSLGGDSFQQRVADHLGSSGARHLTLTVAESCRA